MPLDRMKYIAVEGVIGAGKTTLASMLTRTLGAKSILEKFDENPFLEEFYKEPKHFALQTQLFFLLSRFKQLENIRQRDLFQDKIVGDYIFEKDRIFATLNLSSKEMLLYDGIAKLMEKEVLAPDLVIYLQASTEHLMKSIRKRGRSYEKNISKDYILALGDLYNKFFFHYEKAPVLVIKTDELDFQHVEKDYYDILLEIDKHDGGTKYYIPQR
jgi:deoxyadenosine/deoxycytidine kinase